MHLKELNWLKRRLLSCFSRVRPRANPIDSSHQAPLSLGFSRQEHWSGLPFPPPMHERKSESEVAQPCPTLSDPMDCTLPGSTRHGIFQARVLEWGAIAFSKREVWYSLKSNWRGQEKKKGIIHTTFKIFEKLLLIKRSFKDSKH